MNPTLTSDIFVIVTKKTTGIKVGEAIFVVPFSYTEAGVCTFVTTRTTSRIYISENNFELLSKRKNPEYYL